MLKTPASQSCLLRQKLTSSHWSPLNHWRELKEREGLQSDAEVALFLLDRGVTPCLHRKRQLSCRAATAKVCLHWTQ
uniref:Uncharacterized protein n=1 Tax=Sinocyclocheilus grahami TaxID=75366 RepID=A0A672RQ37_SINGR